MVSDNSSLGLEVIDDGRIIVEAIKSFDTPERIEALEAEMLEAGSITIPTRHSFAAGIYAREITLPKGTIAIGHAHTEECLNIVVSGSVSVLINGEMKLVAAPATFPSAPFSRKIGYVHEDCCWITVHPINCRSIDKIESEIISKSPSFVAYENAHKDEGTSIATIKADEFFEDRLDYFKFIMELGLTNAQVKAIVENESDQCDAHPEHAALTYIGSSRIQGNGVFAAFPFSIGQSLGTARVTGFRTKVGRYANHSKSPNVSFNLESNGNVYVTALRQINAGEEVTVDYRQAYQEARLADFITTNNSN